MFTGGDSLVANLVKSWGKTNFSVVARRCNGPYKCRWKSLPFNHRQLSTTSVQMDTCMPTPLAPKCGPQNCVIPKPNIWKDCKVKKRPSWKGCDKICMPCCCPAWSPPDCDQLELRMNTCKRVEYRIPAYSECRKYPMITKKRKECCLTEQACPELGLDEIFEPLTSTKVRQETILGRRKKVRGQGRNFSTAATALKSDNNVCQKAGALPCLKPSNVASSMGKKEKQNCNKICLPCCPPARDPPECQYPAVKAECNRLKPPRPSFSECDKQKMTNIPECECHEQPIPPCNAVKEQFKGSC